MAPDRLCCTMISHQGVEPRPTHPSNIAKEVVSLKAISRPGSRSRHHHRAALYTKAGASGLYRPACLRRFGRRRRAVHDLSSSQGQFMVRAYSAKLPYSTSPRSGHPGRIGGGFAARPSFIFEPCPRSSKQSGRAVKMVMSREEVSAAPARPRAGSSKSSSRPKKDVGSSRRS